MNELNTTPMDLHLGVNINTNYHLYTNSTILKHIISTIHIVGILLNYRKKLYRHLMSD